MPIDLKLLKMQKLKEDFRLFNPKYIDCDNIYYCYCFSAPIFFFKKKLNNDGNFNKRTRLQLAGIDIPSLTPFYSVIY